MTTIKRALIVLLDDTYHEWWESMPYASTRPYGKWIRFNNGCAVFPLCAPSRASIITGRYPHKLKIDSNNTPLNLGIDPAHWITGELSARGVSTGWFGKIANGFPWNGRFGTPGNYIPEGIDRAFVFTGGDYYDYGIIDKPHGGTPTRYTVTGEDPENYSTDRVGAEAVEWLDARGDEEEWFCYVAPFAPHAGEAHPPPAAPRHEDADVGEAPHPPNYNWVDPIYPPPWQGRPYSPLGGVRQGGGWPLPEDVLAQYDATTVGAMRAVLSCDDVFRDLVDLIDSKGWMDETFIFLAGDNGNMMGAHRGLSKGRLWNECVQLRPLIHWPGFGAGSTYPVDGDNNADSEAMLGFIDIAPTIAEAFGFELSGTPTVDGHSLVPLLEGDIEDADHREWLLLRRGHQHSRVGWAAKSREWTFIEYPWVRGEVNTELDRFELYDEINDPYQMRNLAHVVDCAPFRAALTELLDVHDGSILDAYDPDEPGDGDEDGDGDDDDSEVA